MKNILGLGNGELTDDGSDSADCRAGGNSSGRFLAVCVGCCQNGCMVPHVSFLLCYRVSHLCKAELGQKEERTKSLVTAGS